LKYFARAQNYIARLVLLLEYGRGALFYWSFDMKIERRREAVLMNENSLPLIVNLAWQLVLLILFEGFQEARKTSDHLQVKSNGYHQDKEEFKLANPQFSGFVIHVLLSPVSLNPSTPHCCLLPVVLTAY